MLQLIPSSYFSFSSKIGFVKSRSFSPSSSIFASVSCPMSLSLALSLYLTFNELRCFCSSLVRAQKSSSSFARGGRRPRSERPRWNRPRWNRTPRSERPRSYPFYYAFILEGLLDFLGSFIFFLINKFILFFKYINYS